MIIRKWFFLIFIVLCNGILFSQEQYNGTISNLSEKLIDAIIKGDWEIANEVAAVLINNDHNSAIGIAVKDISKFILRLPTTDGSGLSIYDYPYTDKPKITSIIDFFDNNLSKFPSNENLILMKAILSFKGLADPEKAISNLEKVLEINPNNLFALNSLGGCYGGSRRYDDAERLFLRVLKIDSLSGSAYNGLGMIALSKGDWNKAEVLFNKSIRCKDADAMSWFNLGSLYAAQTKYDDAKPMLEKAVAICPNLLDARWNLAGIYYQSGETTKSINQMKIIIEVAHYQIMPLDPGITFLRWGINGTFKNNNKQQTF